MKAADLLGSLKTREERPAVLITMAVIAYLVAVSLPGAIRAVGDVWGALSAFGIADNSLGTCLWYLGVSCLGLLSLLAGIGIWVASIFVSWAAFRKSRKRAYVLVLAGFLIPLAREPTAWVSSRLFSRPAVASQAGELAANGAMVINRTIELPVAPFLFLAGLWGLYRSERLVTGGPSGCVHGVKP